jgi:hypothetical protein
MMKKYSLLLLIISGIIGTIMMLGNAGGVALIQKLDRTASPLSNGPCQECHSSGNFNTSVDIKLISDGNPVTKYIPGTVYTFQVVINANQNAQQFGFQAVALQGPGNSQAGTFQNPPTGIAVRTVNNRSYPEQKFPSLVDTFRLEWLAPVAGTGDVKLYAAGVATNANGNSAGDGAAFSSLTIQEDGASFITDNRPTGFRIVSLVPGQFIQLQVPDQAGEIALYDLQGRLIQTAKHQGTDQLQVDLHTQMSGIYLLQWRGPAGMWTEKILIP